MMLLTLSESIEKIKYMKNAKLTQGGTPHPSPLPQGAREHKCGRVQ